MISRTEDSSSLSSLFAWLLPARFRHCHLIIARHVKQSRERERTSRRLSISQCLLCRFSSSSSASIESYHRLSTDTNWKISETLSANRWPWERESRFLHRCGTLPHDRDELLYLGKRSKKSPCSSCFLSFTSVCRGDKPKRRSLSPSLCPFDIWWLAKTQRNSNILSLVILSSDWCWWEKEAKRTYLDHQLIEVDRFSSASDRLKHRRAYQTTDAPQLMRTEICSVSLLQISSSILSLR